MRSRLVAILFLPACMLLLRDIPWSLASGPTATTELIPSGSLSVAYRQLLEGKLSEGVFHTHLECHRGQCSLTTLTLNLCIAGAWYPKILRWTTLEGNLTVTRASPGLLLVEYKELDTTLKMRFEFTVDQSSPVAKLYGGTRFEKLTGFSGGAVNASSMAGKVVTWELVPLRGAAPEIGFSCKAVLDGVPE